MKEHRWDAETHTDTCDYNEHMIGISSILGFLDHCGKIVTQVNRGTFKKQNGSEQRH